jgi:hypothetical protein
MTLAPPSCARWTKARRTADLPIPAIPCTQITRVSPRKSSSRARSSASRPTKTRRRWGTAVAMTAVSLRAPPGCKGGFRHARRPRPSAWDAPASGCQRYCQIAAAISSQSKAPSDAVSERGGTEHLSTPSCLAVLGPQQDRRAEGGEAGPTPATQSCSVRSLPAPGPGRRATRDVRSLRGGERLRDARGYIARSGRGAASAGERPKPWPLLHPWEAVAQTGVVRAV